MDYKTFTLCHGTQDDGTIHATCSDGRRSIDKNAWESIVKILSQFKIPDGEDSADFDEQINFIILNSENTEFTHKTFHSAIAARINKLYMLTR
jgi:hypothetical protein